MFMTNQHRVVLLTGGLAAFWALFLMPAGIGCAKTGEPATPATPITPATLPSGASLHAFAVVELFTSEGCSSCPPADTLLGELVGEARSRDLPVYALSFHVDYWDRLGWKDPFSAAEYSSRQRKYAEASGGDGVYTPQMIVNGRNRFAGSDAREAREQIRSVLEQPSNVEVVVRAGTAVGGRLPIAYEVKGARAGAVLNLALVERGLTTRVRRGENAGRTLRHENVVRSFATTSLKGASAGKIDLKPPDSLDPKNASIIGYVQDEKSMAVLGGARADLE